MLTFHSSPTGLRAGPGTSRRAFLRVGSLGLGGLSLLNTLHASAASSITNHVARGKSVVFLFMQGGPSQTETFDPKMTAPPGIRSETGEVSTALPGVTFAGTFPKLAALADRLAVVRSFVTGDGRHDIKPIVSRYSLDANIGTLYSRVVGMNHPGTGIPTHVALYPQAVDETTEPSFQKFGSFESTGSLGAGYKPFAPGAGGQLQKDLELNLPTERLLDRRRLLTELDRLRREMETNPSAMGMDRLRAQAFDSILGGVAQAFDLSQESPETIRRYDTAPLARPDDISRKWNNHSKYVDHVKSLGKLLLLARRMCEAGCGVVTVTTSFVWDMHADSNNAGVREGMDYIGRPFDHAVSAFIEDTVDRGLSDDILLVACGEMGRTPRLNSRGGRDHWGGIAPLLLAGGGLRMGQVIGRSNNDASRPESTPLGIDRLVSTILNTQFNISELRLVPGMPADIIRLASQAEPIPGLL